MKNSISHIAGLLFAVLLLGCGGEPRSESSTELGDDILKTEKPTKSSKSKSDKVTEERINQIRDSIDRVKTAISPFLEEGCCSEEKGQKEETC